MSVATDIRSYDVVAPSAVADAIGLLHRIRQGGPIAWLPRLNAYLLTRHADIVAALKDRRLETPRTRR